MPGCDIIMPVWNQLELTRNCIDSLEKNTSFPYRLIVVDNASNPKTLEYLEGLKNRLKDMENNWNGKIRDRIDR